MNQWYTQSICLYFYSNISIWIYFAYNVTQETTKKNVIKLVPMNPDVSLAEKDVLKRPLLINVKKSTLFLRFKFNQWYMKDDDEWIIEWIMMML